MNVVIPISFIQYIDIKLLYFPILTIPFVLHLGHGLGGTTQ